MIEPSLLLTDPIRTFLARRQVAYVSTLDAQGYPHTVPTWYDVDGEDLIFSVYPHRARVKHIQANPKGAVTVGGTLSDTEGYLFQGLFALQDGSALLTEKIAHRYLDDEQVKYMRATLPPTSEYNLLRFTPTKVLKVR